MKKPNITRTYGPIHFEDLDPHRFEDLVRELIYDYKDWQSIEATGRSGSDDGFDIRGYEKVSNYYSEVEDDDLNLTSSISFPMDGNLWMIQCKRESEIGPQKVSSIISSGVDLNTPPYGYILVASANFSKKSYDIFRESLKNLGVMEFYLWGKAELEDMLHMPKYDRILFTFFGISLVSKKRSRTMEIRSRVAIKNRVMKMIGEENQIQNEILVRDINDIHYPFEDKYSDFLERPRWGRYHFKTYNVHGIWLELHEYYGYLDKISKEWDYTTQVDLSKLYEEHETEEERISKMNNNNLVRDFWEYFRKHRQVKVSVWGLLKFEDIVITDEKGDIVNNLPHFYVDFKNLNGPFSRILHVIDHKNEVIFIKKEDYRRIKIFPNSIPESKKGKIHTRQSISLDTRLIKSLKNYKEDAFSFYDNDGKYNFLNPKDIVSVSMPDNMEGEIFLKITNKYNIQIKDYLAEYADDYFINQTIQDQLGTVDFDGFINVYEFLQTYRQSFE